MQRKICFLLFLLCLVSGAFGADDPTVQTIDSPWLVLRAFMISYPDRITGVDYDFEKRDWFMAVDKTRLFWAGGRLLPESQCQNSDKWRAYVDYLYPVTVPDPVGFSDDTIAQLNADVLAETRKKSTVYNMSFYDLLYDGATRGKIESHIVRINYLGHLVSVHENIVPYLRKVEKKVYQLAKTDPDAKSFIASIARIEGYNWREIADTPSRSNHSWGIAIDILPKNWGRKNIYWNWVSYWNANWMLIPLNRRWMPPASVISAFEEEGFIWGGKWLLWDDMHFEYRPELIVLQKWGHTGDLKE